MPASLPIPKPYQRLESFPLDDSEVFTVLATLEAYAASPVAYAGQTVKRVDVGANTVDVFKILPNGSIINEYQVLQQLITNNVSDLDERINSVENIMSTDTERIDAVNQLIANYQLADSDLNQTITTALTGKVDKATYNYISAQHHFTNGIFLRGDASATFSGSQIKGWYGSMSSQIGFVFETSHVNAMAINHLGNIGLNNTDIEAWFTAYGAIETPFSSLMYGKTVPAFYILNNLYYDGAWKYKSTNYASRYVQYNGTHSFVVYPSGNIDTTAVGVEALAIKDTGFIGINNSAPLAYLDLKTKLVDEVALRLSHYTSPGEASYEIKWQSASVNLVHRVQYSNVYYDVIDISRATRNVNFPVSISEAGTLLSAKYAAKELVSNGLVKNEALTTNYGTWKATRIANKVTVEWRLTSNYTFATIPSPLRLHLFPTTYTVPRTPGGTMSYIKGNIGSYLSSDPDDYMAIVPTSDGIFNVQYPVVFTYLI